MSILRANKGFTLIELLIVISIIMIITVIGLVSYNSLRRGTVADIEIESLAAELHSLRDLSRSHAACYGIRFEKNSSPKRIEAAFLPTRQTCADKNSKTLLTALFLPPEGRIEFNPKGTRATVTLGHSRNTRSLTLETISGKIEIIGIK